MHVGVCELVTKQFVVAAYLVVFDAYLVQCSSSCRMHTSCVVGIGGARRGEQELQLQLSC